MLANAELGSGPAIIFLPGITCSREHWRPVADLLSSDHRCVLIDPPGHGESEPGPMGVIEQAAAIHEVVETLSLERPVVVGHSAGGIAAAIYAIVHPCRGVFSIEGTLDLTGPFAQDVHSNRELILDPDRFDEGFRNVLAPMRSDLIPHERRDWALSLIGGTRDVVLDAWRDLLAGRGGEIKEQLKLALPSLGVPLLVLWGDEVPEGEREMIASVPAGSTESWPGMGHFIHLVDPARTADRIRDFVRSIDG